MVVNSIKYFICFMLCFVFISGCKGNLSGSSDTLKAIVVASPSSLDPRLALDAEGMKFANLIFDGLFEKDDDLNIKPALAVSYEQPSETTYIINLRKDVKFHDEKPFKAEDVVYTYRSVMDGEVNSPLRGSFSRIKNIEAVDDYQIKLELKEPYAPIFTILMWGIVPSTYANRATDLAKHPIGTGPYKYVDFVPEISLNFEANSEYFGNKPRTKNLSVEIVQDDNIRALKLIKGDTDIIQNGVSQALIPKILENKDIKIVTKPSTVVSYMGMNLTDPILKNQKVRQAIAYGIDVNEIIKHRLDGYAVKANSILSPNIWAYNKNLKSYNYNPELAEKLLDEAGFKRKTDGYRFVLNYKTSTFKLRISMAELIANQLKKIGIKVNVNSYEWGTLFNDIKRGNFQIYTLQWVGVTEPDIYYDILSSTEFPPEGLNRDRYKNPVIDKLVKDARIELDESKRKVLYDKIQEIALFDLPFIPLWYEENIVLYRSNLEGVKTRPDASYRIFGDILKK